MLSPLLSSRRARVRAPLSLLMAGCLGAGALAAISPATASAATPTSSASSSAADSSRASDLLNAVPQDNVPQNYVPAGCNNPSVEDGVAQCFADVRTGSDHIVKPQAVAPPSTALGPADIQAAYSLPAGGEGRTVAIVDAYGNSHAEADLAEYRKHYGLPECTTANGCFRKVDQNGGTDYPVDDAGWALETALDLDAVSAACPACNILLVQGDSATLDDLGTAVDTAVRLGAKYVSNSYGLPGEGAFQTAYDHHYDHPGVAVVASTGDTGHVQNWPATNPNVVAAGGTRLTRTEDTARGWTESAWTSGGSGCSLYEAQPAYQRGLATGCDTRATADVSAVADPATGLAVYSTAGQDGWLQVGGTSLSAPLIAAMYALAGTPVEDTYPVTYPYINASGLTDVTEGANDDCGTVVCTAGAGWDGPTGLGTPVGVSALAFGVHGTLSGRVTDSESGAPLAGAGLAISEEGTDGREYRITTDAEGAYSLPVAVGDYRITATDFGYREITRSGVSVAENQSTTADLALVKLPTRTVSGTVKDGSGHGWPLYSKITIDGYPNGALYTDPYTGKYSVELPEEATYDVHVAPVYPGYRSTDRRVPVGTADVRTDVAPDVDLASCVAPGHAYPAETGFEGWTGTTPEHGWTVVNHGTDGAAWDFADKSVWNFTGGTGNWASASPYTRGVPEDTELVSPTFSLAGQTSPVLGFNAAYAPSKDSVADVDLSLDSGATWTTVWHRDTAEYLGHAEVSLPQAANAKHVKVRFHYSGSGLSLWQLDTVTVGSCAAVSGGIVAGKVVDGNTGDAITPATVTDTADRYATATTVATPDDLALADGYYWLFSEPTGRHTYRTAAARYSTSTGTLTTRPDKVNRFDRTLKAGLLKVSSDALSVSESLGGSGSKKVTFTNKGQAPIHVNLGEQSTGYTSPDGTPTTTSDSSAGAPTLRVKGNYAPGPMSSTASASKSTPSDLPATAAAAAAGAASTGPWTGIADYPGPVMDNAVGTYQGKVYSVAGVSGIFGGEYLKHSYVHDPSTDAWTPIADLPEALESPGGAFIDGTMYVAGGWAADGAHATLYAYHPTTDDWTRLADLPQAVGMPNVTVLGGSLYVIGGCTGSGCNDMVSTVYRYTPATDTWTRLADYPFDMERAACAGITGELVCAGGLSGSDAKAETYRYSPSADTWTRAADMPDPRWGAIASGNDGRLQAVGGIAAQDAVNTVVEYDPVSNTWSDLPNSGSAVFRAGGGCGIYRVGGMISLSETASSAEVLPGHDQCDGDDVTWLSADRTSFDLAPGRSTTVTVRADASAVATAGTYTARLTYSTDGPYAGASVKVSLKVTIPRTWGHLSGTITDRRTGAPLAGATVQICPAAHAGATGCDRRVHTVRTVRTDSDGHYDLWLDARPGPLRITASATGHRPASKEVTLLPGRATTADLSLTVT
ncbi:carboxypeptidase regulatory-like domain-containing protein [Streptomyces sp. SID12501]|uniref:Galactose oxidase n=1 Tax=Streptomyces sp. SID12501 TaxID=2706042 RepID=A0A6B3BQG3_9ACTN|nr:carboxypeptidase regulatory-like domain-containing protein [Streptomyces sp. SID12501]NEC86543.1 galactose oxidase [Streptomyces sp. SID12501]